MKKICFPILKYFSAIISITNDGTIFYFCKLHLIWQIRIVLYSLYVLILIWHLDWCRLLLILFLSISLSLYCKHILYIWFVTLIWIRNIYIVARSYAFVEIHLIPKIFILTTIVCPILCPLHCLVLKPTMHCKTSQCIENSCASNTSTMESSMMKNILLSVGDLFIKLIFCLRELQELLINWLWLRSFSLSY
jgi:hypothetical protein